MIRVIVRGAAMLTVATLAIFVSLVRADDSSCGKLKVYPIGRSGVVRLTWLDDPAAIRYTVQRASSSQSAFVDVVATAENPLTNVALDQVSAADTYTYRVRIDRPGNVAPHYTTTELVTVPSPATGKNQVLDAVTLVKETFDENRLNVVDWVPSLPTDPKSTASWQLKLGRLVLDPLVSMKVNVPLQSSSVKLSDGGLEIVARVKVQGDSIGKGADKIAASIGYDTTAADGFIVKLALHDCGSAGGQDIQLLTSKKPPVAEKANTSSSWIPRATIKVAWQVDEDIWLKLSVNRKTGKVLALAWKDTDALPPSDDDAISYTIPAARSSLPGLANFYAESGTASFGEVIVEDLPGPPPPPATASEYPKPPIAAPTEPKCQIASGYEEPTGPRPEPLPGLQFCRRWPNSALAVKISSAPSARWKMSQRGLSVRPDPRTVEDEVILVGAARSSGGFGLADPDSPSSQYADYQKTPDHLFVFLGPAIFPLPRYQNFSPPFDDDGAIIRESMNVRASNDGKFEVEFRVMAPAMPVTLRLQLGLHRGREDFGRITLPSVVLDPEKLRRDEDEGDTWRVVYHGYSRALAQAMDWCCLDTLEPIEITRQGAARFGSGVTAVGLFEDE